MAKQYGQGKRNSKPIPNTKSLRYQINRFFDKRTLDLTEPHEKAILRSLRSDAADFFNRRILRSKPRNEAIMRSLRSTSHDDAIMRSLRSVPHNEAILRSLRSVPHDEAKLT